MTQPATQPPSTIAKWTTHPSAPAEGTVVCAVGDATGRATCVEIGGFPIVIVREVIVREDTGETLRAGGEFRAFVNACPHKDMPLDRRSDRVVSADGMRLHCTNHEASFDIETGAGIAGWGEGCALDPVPVHVAAGHIHIGAQSK